MDASDEVVETLGPGADFRHDYDYLAGYRPRSERALERLLEFRRRSDQRSRSELKRAVDEHLGPLRSRLYESPYYREVLREAGLSPDDLRSVDDLSAFPTLDRYALGRRLEEVAVVDPESRAWRDAGIYETSGSTGDPIDVLRDGYDLLHMWTMVRYWARRMKVELPSQPVVVLLCALPSGLEYTSRLPTLDDGRLYRISTRRPQTRERLLRADPDVLFSDPAGFHWLTGAADAPDPAMALSSAQYLAPDLRGEVEERLGAPIVNYYSATETGPIAWECLDTTGRFHVLVPDVWVESVDGDLRVTRLRPSVLPLLRYRPGDTGRVVFDRCECGYSGWSIVDFQGRRVCAFERPDGEQEDAWQLARFFKYLDLDRFRVTQTGVSTFRVELGSGEGGRPDDTKLRQQLSAALERLGWESVDVEVERVDTIDVRGDKPRPFHRADF